MPAPVLFISHGAPDIALQKHAATLACWQTLGQTLPRPQAILVLSAHWDARLPVISTAEQPTTIHDFGGFPPALYQLRYPAPGAPQLAGKVAGCLEAAGIPLTTDSRRGLDHGAWIPLLSMYPQADIPVTQLAIQSHAGPEWHLRVGETLRPLREENILIMASGAITHNFAWLSRQNAPLPAAQTFSDWLAAKLEQRDMNALLNYRTQAPFGAEAHPTEEHLLPLFAAFGASTANDKLTRFAPEFTYSALAMDAYLWE